MNNREFLSGANATPPTAPATPSAGYPSGGNPATATPATNPGPFWFHQIGEEIRNVIAGAGIAPSSGALDQLLTALNTLFKVHMSVDVSGVLYGFDVGSLRVVFGTGNIPSGSNAAQADIGFGTGLLAGFSGTYEVFAIARGRANSGWGPVTCMAQPLDARNARVFFDTANTSQALQAGLTFSWLAIGRNAAVLVG